MRLKPLIPAFLAALSVQAQAKERSGFFLNPAAYYATETATTSRFGSSSKDNATVTRLNATAGYVLETGLALGVKYLYETNTSSSTDQANSTGLRLTAGGVAIGFVVGPFGAFLSSMLIQTPVRKDIAQKVTYYGGDGATIDLMYYAFIGNIGLGPQISWRSFDYVRMKSNNPQADASPPKLNETVMQPYVSIWIAF